MIATRAPVLLMIVIAAGCKAKAPVPPAVDATVWAPAVVQPVRAESRALLVRVGRLLVPLACFDNGKKEINPGDFCVDLIATRPEVEVRTLSGEAKVVRLGKAVPGDGLFSNYAAGVFQLPCAPDASDEAACARQAQSLSTLVTWPPRGVTLSPAAPVGQGEAVPDQIAQAITAALSELGLDRKLPLSFAAGLATDVDGDGARELVVGVRAKTGATTTPSQVHYLFLVRGSTPVRLRVPDAVAAGALASDAELVAAVDLDGDRADELLLSNGVGQNATFVLARARQGLEVLGALLRE